MKITCVSDLHGHYPQLERGELLIVAGDLTANDCIGDYYRFYEWLASQNFECKIFIGGNHDNLLAKGLAPCPKHCDAHYLCDSGIKYKGYRIWGSPWTLRFKGENRNCLANTCFSEQELFDKFERIPLNTDILVTHSPCWGVLDRTVLGDHVGSMGLTHICNNIKHLKAHIFGHVHEGYNKKSAFVQIDDSVKPSVYTAVNASHVDENYKPVNKPIIIEI